MKHQIFLGVLLLVLATGYSQSSGAQQQPAPSAQQSQTPQQTQAVPQPQTTEKKVQIEIVEQREQAEYEITGTSESKKASNAKKIIMGSWHSDEDASIKVANLKTGEIVYAYAAHKKDSAHGQRSTAEACAKHLKDEGVAAK